MTNFRDMMTNAFNAWLEGAEEVAKAQYGGYIARQKFYSND